MEIVFTDNIQRKLIDTLSPAIAEAKTAKFAVAFMKYSGFSLMEENLMRCVTNGGQAEFLVGLDFHTTEPKVLRKLHELSDKGYAIDYYCFSDPSLGDSPVYHPKLYLLLNNEKAVIAIGSSNLTRGGLKSNVEANAVISADLSEEIVSDIYGLYSRLKFKQSRFKPDLEYIEKYEYACKRVGRISAKVLLDKATKEAMQELREREEALPKPKPSETELFGWQKIVYERLPLGTFRTSDVYRWEKEFQVCYPENRHIRDKIRQILQQLEDIGLIKHPRTGRWERF